MGTRYEEKDFRYLPQATLGDDEGYIYVLDFGSEIKIGSTRNPRKRSAILKSFYRNKKTETLTLLLSKKHQGYKAHEKILHAMFKNFHYYGEFFKISIDQFLLKLGVEESVI